MFGGWRDAGFEHGTAGFAVRCTTIEPPLPPMVYKCLCRAKRLFGCLVGTLQQFSIEEKKKKEITEKKKEVEKKIEEKSEKEKEELKVKRRELLEEQKKKKLDIRYGN